MEGIENLLGIHIQPIDTNADVGDDATVLDPVLQVPGHLLGRALVVQDLKGQVAVGDGDLGPLHELGDVVRPIQKPGLELVVVIDLAGQIALELQHVALQVLVVEAGLGQAILIRAEEIEVDRVARVGVEEGKVAVGVSAAAIDTQILLGLHQTLDEDEVAILTLLDDAVAVIVRVPELAAAGNLGDLELIEGAGREHVAVAQVGHGAELPVADSTLGIVGVLATEIAVHPAAEFSTVVDHAAGGEFESLDATQMRGLGEHIVYEIATPVSIRAKQSAVVTIARRSVSGEKVCCEYCSGSWLVSSLSRQPTPLTRSLARPGPGV